MLVVSAGPRLRAGAGLDEGLPAAFRRHHLLAEAVRAAVRAWSKEAPFELNILDSRHCSDAVTTIRMLQGAKPDPITTFCRENCGVILGKGIGDLSGEAFRIAHMGHVNAPMMLGTLGIVESSLAALGIAHGKGGIQAAVDWIAEAAPAARDLAGAGAVGAPRAVAQGE